MDFLFDVEQCLSVLRNKDGIILYPTDTIWGIGCDATNNNAVRKIYQLKKREDSKAMIVLVAEERDVLKYVTQLDLKIFDYLKTTTKPTTVIYRGAVGFAENLMAADGTIAIRIVQDTFCKHLIKRLGKPLVSTSANISGKSSPQFFADIDTSIVQGVDYVVRYRQKDNEAKEPSTIVKYGVTGNIEIIRP